MYQRSILLYFERIPIVLRIHVFQSCILMYPVRIPEYTVTHMLPNYVERILIIRKGRAGFSTVLQKLGIGALAR